jgi:hypothetical protein
MSERLPHTVFWDDPGQSNQQLDAGELMRRLARVLGADFKERTFRGEPRYELHRVYGDGLELAIIAGHIYDTRETLSLALELRSAGRERPLASYHLSGGLQRVKVSGAVAWLRAANGTVLIVGDGLGGLVEVQN